MDPLLQRIVGNPVQHLLARSSAPWKKTMLQRRGAKKRQRQQTPRKDAEAPPAVSNNADALLVGLQTFSCYSCPASLDSRLLAATPVRLRGAVRDKQIHSTAICGFPECLEYRAHPTQPHPTPRHGGIETTRGSSPPTETYRPPSIEFVRMVCLNGFIR